MPHLSHGRPRDNRQTRGLHDLPFAALIKNGRPHMQQLPQERVRRREKLAPTSPPELPDLPQPTFTRKAKELR